MQYCFGNDGLLVEQSPFSVEYIGENNATFCWREGLVGMATHAANCSGCDCAKIHIELDKTDDTLHFQFWQSPPIIHTDMKLTRHPQLKTPPNMTIITSTMNNPYNQCTFVDHFGPNLPGEPDLRPNKTRSRGGCAAGAVLKHKLLKKIKDDVSKLPPIKPGEGRCRQLNGINFLGQVILFLKTKAQQHKICLKAVHFNALPISQLAVSRLCRIVCVCARARVNVT